MSAIEDAGRIHYQLQRLFTWTADAETYGIREHWDDHYDDFKAGKPFKDDCDGFSLTAALIASNDYQIPPEKISLNLCLTEVGIRLKNPPAYDHIVCVVGGYVIDNRLRRVVQQGQTGYLWDRAMRLDEVGVWR